MDSANILRIAKAIRKVLEVVNHQCPTLAKKTLHQQYLRKVLKNLKEIKLYTIRNSKSYNDSLQKKYKERQQLNMFTKLELFNAPSILYSHYCPDLSDKRAGKVR